MKRRGFLNRACAALAAVPFIGLIKTSDAREPEVYPWILDALKARLTQKPRFDGIHYCHECETTYLCPDRYIRDRCGPAAELKRMRMGDGVNQTCTPCLGKYDEVNRSAWFLAHGIVTGKKPEGARP